MKGKRPPRSKREAARLGAATGDAELAKSRPIETVASELRPQTTAGITLQSAAMAKPQPTRSPEPAKPHPLMGHEASKIEVAALALSQADPKPAAPREPAATGPHPGAPEGAPPGMADFERLSRNMGRLMEET